MGNRFEWGDVLPTLQGSRVILRALRPEDVPALYEIFSDPQVMRYWSSPPLADRSAAATLLAEIEALFRSRTLFQWGVAEKTSDAVMGTCTLFRFDKGHWRAEIGFALGSTHWGRGYMTEALATLLRFGFEGLGLHRLEADADPRNVRCIRTLKQQGFEREGYLRERWGVGGGIQDTVLYGLLARDWRGPDAAQSNKGRDRIVSGKELMARFPELLESIEQDRAVYFVEMDAGAASAPSNVLGGPFVLGPAERLGMFDLVDEEYGWPEEVQVADVKSVFDLAPKTRCHPMIYRGSTLIGMAISIGEYQLLQQSGRDEPWGEPE